MKAGEVADGLKIDKGVKAVAKALGRKGYIAARIGSAPAFDDKNQRVAFKLDITEGPQYKMGELVLTGFSEGDAKTLRERWSLKAGDVFDATYAEEFLKTDGREVVQRIFEERRSPPRIRSDIKANRQALTVDVSLELAK
jgi:outer membrane protein assembly factor BamA